MSSTHFSRIIVADDHPMFCDALKQILRDTYPVADIRAAFSLADAIELTAKYGDPDLLVLDLVFPGMDGETSIRNLRQKFQRTSIVIVTMFEDLRVGQKLIDAGADAFLGKGLSAQELIDSFERVRNGEFVLEISSNSDAMMFTKPGSIPVITPRQSEIMALLSKNYTNKIIARNLGISHFTVRNHVSILMRLLNVNTRSEISIRAEALGLLDPEDFESRS